MPFLRNMELLSAGANGVHRPPFSARRAKDGPIELAGKAVPVPPGTMLRVAEKSMSLRVHPWLNQARASAGTN